MIFALLSHFDSWTMEFSCRGTVHPCCTGLGLPSLNVGFKTDWWPQCSFSDDPPPPPGDEEQPFHGLLEYEGEKFSVFSAKAERKKGYMSWYVAVSACNVNSSSPSFQGSHAPPSIWTFHGMESLGKKLCDLDLKGFGVNSLYLMGT